MISDGFFLLATVLVAVGVSGLVLLQIFTVKCAACHRRVYRRDLVLVTTTTLASYAQKTWETKTQPACRRCQPNG